MCKGHISYISCPWTYTVCETNILPTLEKYGASTLEYLSNDSVCSQPSFWHSSSLTLFVTFLRKVHFVVSTYSICSGLENQTVTEVYNTTIVNLQSSHLLQGLIQITAHATLPGLSLLCDPCWECGAWKHLLITYPSCFLYLGNTVLARCFYHPWAGACCVICKISV